MLLIGNKLVSKCKSALIDVICSSLVIYAGFDWILLENPCKLVAEYINMRRLYVLLLL